MTADAPRRAMWLLNHGAARNFEIPMLKRSGYGEIFLPKIYPQLHSFRSASVDWSEDANLTIPKADLDRLNAVNWYTRVAKADWEIANRHFDIAFFIANALEGVHSIGQHFAGALIWRAYGMNAGMTYSRILGSSDGASLALEAARSRLWFAEAYLGIGRQEGRLLEDRSLYLPLGLANATIDDRWTGRDRRILFVCPEIVANPYYRDVYLAFVKQFGDLPYAIGGAQPLAVDDPRVLGFLPKAEHERNMQDMRVMFYHSREPNHVHYHPFEAIRYGMPVIFMAGGLFARLSGGGQPGEAADFKEAHKKLERILAGDTDFVERVRRAQAKTLEAMDPVHCEPHWRRSMATVASALERQRPVAARRKARRRRVGVLLPYGYRGGTLKAAKLIAEALFIGSREAGEPAEIVFAHLDNAALYADADFATLPPQVTVRPFVWNELDHDGAALAMKLAGYENWRPNRQRYFIPDDGINHLADCDLWVVVSDRVHVALLPIRPYLLVVFDYLQRYVSAMPPGADHAFLDAAHRALEVLVTTEFAGRDATQYAGVPPERVRKLPMLAPIFDGEAAAPSADEKPYFVWPTNRGPHKNHEKALRALLVYHEELGGTLECRITGVDTATLLDGAEPPLDRLGRDTSRGRRFRRRVRTLGEVSDVAFRDLIAGSRFVWHPAEIDNGTFSVVEAASVGTPALSSDYPPMREMNAQFSLGLTYMDARDPEDMARKLKWMETHHAEAKAGLPSRETLGRQSVQPLAGAYWAAVRGWL